jgi:hypothetical protein
MPDFLFFVDNWAWLAGARVLAKMGGFFIFQVAPLDATTSGSALGWGSEGTPNNLDRSLNCGERFQQDQNQSSSTGKRRVPRGQRGARHGQVQTRTSAATTSLPQ